MLRNYLREFNLRILKKVFQRNGFNQKPNVFNGFSEP
jgi:hypothetical protein